MRSPDVDVEKKQLEPRRLIAAHFRHERTTGRQNHLLLRIFGHDETLGRDAQDEGVLAKGELARPFRTLPRQVLFHEVNVVQGGIVKVRVGNDGRAGGDVAVARI